MKKPSRRQFINTSLALGAGAFLNSCQSTKTVESGQLPIIISTWNNVQANNAAWETLTEKGNILDAVEAGARVPEADPADQSVGYGGRPDREGNVTLDACIMDKDGNCGAVTFLQHIKHPISVARKVMEETPHVMLSGAGALEFALEQGFEKQDLLTEKSKQEYIKWLETAEYKPKVNIELHDTIGIIGADSNGDLSGACTTSGLAYKMPGRVGDSPIIGAGLFVDNEVGSAVATGMGELVMRSVGSFLVVELMRQGLSPYEACKEAVMRIVRRQDTAELQVGYIAMNKDGTYGAYSIKPGFVFAVTDENGTIVKDAESYE
ncbi:N(4)-(beta-N-acetylglucosaminyl)-L-asparaginase [Portibacter marinus]|uniref:N(4)-(beta-N-acetylglucosaminyl)-L-asparaginase n=1 Tax=Portibacter marinus TaxID=2898660 RepID=UPI001F33B802|nr:N(4)-(beta-N-acetylglucosaminyl)-L-asparaginase [Portibacter marinus]